MCLSRKWLPLASIGLAAIGSTSSVTASASESRLRPLIVAAFGTSLTHNSGWLKPLQEKMTGCFGRRVKVLDLGRNGQTSEGALQSVQQVIDVRPDVVLIEFSVNDAAWFKGLSLSRSRENTRRIVRTIQGALPGTKTFLMTMNPALGPRGLIRLRLESYYSLYEALASELGIGYIDSRPAWEALADDELRAGIPDGLHPVPELVSRLLVPAILKAVVPECTLGAS